MADICFIIILILFTYWGKKRGLIRTVVSTLSTLVSLILSIFLCAPMSEYILKSKIGETLSIEVEKIILENLETNSPIVTENAVHSATTVLVNIIAFIVVLIMIRIIVSLLAKILNVTAKLPVIKQANSLLGALTGLICGIIVSYITVGTLSAFGTEGIFLEIADSIKDSYLAFYLYDRNVIADILSNIK